ncbi:hypothetical protein [uncultured Duncaniella sp.]|uniref:hypothetical protein n=1 Tax=uncultured Duncaniella sp. TaxID=2768039 RepID=UPI0011CD8CCA|nr:hypothetical protein [uncultured Duncaniella sp.]
MPKLLLQDFWVHQFQTFSPMGIKTSKMMIQRDSDKWQRPQDIASLLSRTAREVLMIVKKYGCRMKVVDKEIWINCEDLLLRDNPPPNKKD